MIKPLNIKLLLLYRQYGQANNCLLILILQMLLFMHFVVLTFNIELQLNESYFRSISMKFCFHSTYHAFYFAGVCWLNSLQYIFEIFMVWHLGWFTHSLIKYACLVLSYLFHYTWQVLSTSWKASGHTVPAPCQSGFHIRTLSCLQHWWNSSQSYLHCCDDNQ